jgi:hypothetical protein
MSAGTVESTADRAGDVPPRPFDEGAPMDDRAVAAYREASQAGDIDALVQTLAPDVRLISPVSDRLTFRGRHDVGVVLEAVYAGLREWRWHTALGAGDRWVLVGEGFIGPLRIGDAMTVDVDPEGGIRTLRPHLRPLPALGLFVLRLTVVLSRHPGTVGRALTAPATSPSPRVGK